MHERHGNHSGVGNGDLAELAKDRVVDLVTQHVETGQWLASYEDELRAQRSPELVFDTIDKMNLLEEQRKALSHILAVNFPKTRRAGKVVSQPEKIVREALERSKFEIPESY